MKRLLSDWQFAVGTTPDCLAGGRPVHLPHTWNVEDGLEEYSGAGWYSTRLTAPEAWRGSRVRVRFGAAFHTAVVYLNGQEVGRHLCAGYTPFVLELTPWLHCGADNELTVMVDNTYTEATLPYARSFDWANDGGLIRPVELLVTGPGVLDGVRVQARPVLTGRGRQDRGPALWSFEADADLAEAGELTLDWAVCGAAADEPLRQGSLTNRLTAAGRTQFAAQTALLPQVEYWHFDHPVRYSLRLTLRRADVVLDESVVSFGFRDLHLEGEKLVLNGEPVRLCGTEWMPGSDLRFGMAEPVSQLERMLALLKESNCVLTRFHWQQDDAVLDWCDANGILVQEELPFWGKDPEVPGEDQWQTASRQLTEMVAAHRNHPCLVAWGVGNELAAQRPETVRYIRRAVALLRRLDPERFANYVSNTWYLDGITDGVSAGDWLMINEYTGTWFPDREVHTELTRFLADNPGRAVMPSEFGLCEPAFSGGDARREEIFLEKMTAYRQYPAIAGTINFCLNDYRTQMGEDGQGKHKRRVHGSTELDGTPKPSYWTVQRECAPFVLRRQADSGVLTCRSDLPCYTMRGYRLQLLGQDGAVQQTFPIPDLAPGQSWTFACEQAVQARVLRPTGWTTGNFSLT